MGGPEKKIHNKAFERMKDTFYQEAFLDINSPDSKLRTFGKLKTLRIGKYLISCLKPENRTDVSKVIKPSP